MATLQSFGDEPPPNVKVESTIPHPDGRGTIIGHIGFDGKRGERIAMLPRDTEEHYFRKFDGYAISLSVLDHLEEREASTVCVVETNGDSRVIEYGRQQFKHGEFVAYDSESNSIVESERAYLNNDEKYDDPQRVLSVAEAVYHWEKSEVSLYE